VALSCKLRLAIFLSRLKFKIGLSVAIKWIIQHETCLILTLPIVVYLLNSERVVRIKLLIDVATILLRKPYHAGLSINMVFGQLVDPAPASWIKVAGMLPTPPTRNSPKLGH